MDKKKVILIGIISATVIISIIMLIVEKPSYPVSISALLILCVVATILIDAFLVQWLNPVGDIQAVNAPISENAFDILLPTHEQAWLFAAGRGLLAAGAPFALASLQDFSRVESKIESTRLPDDVDLPPPKWGLAHSIFTGCAK